MHCSFLYSFIFPTDLQRKPLLIFPTDFSMNTMQDSLLSIARCIPDRRATTSVQCHQNIPQPEQERKHFIRSQKYGQDVIYYRQNNIKTPGSCII